MLHRDDGDDTFATVVTGDRGILVLEQLVRLGVGVDRAGKGGSETGEVGAAVAVWNGVGVAKDVFVIIRRVLHHNVGVAFVFDGLTGVIDFNHTLSGEFDGFFVDALLVLGKLIDEFDNTALVEEFFLLGRLVPLIDQVDANAGIEESEFAESGGEVVEIEIDTCGENGGVGEERNLCAGL